MLALHFYHLLMEKFAFTDVLFFQLITIDIVNIVARRGKHAQS